MSNELQCPSCAKSFSYEDVAPKFCSECGSSLDSTIVPDGSVTVGGDEATLARTIDGSRTQGGADATQELDATHDFSGSSSAPTSRLQAAVPKQVGPYRILNLLGRGGMGAVYRAEELNSGRHVALKILSGHQRQTSDSVERFKREGQIAASISHARSTFVYSAGKESDILYIVMELMPGGTIKDEVTQKGPMSVNRGVDCILDVIDGLEAAHQAGIIHRDIKPSNCFVEDDGRVKVGDYGLSKSFAGDAGLTRTGSFMGTPQFAATEQIKGGTVDERTDIYALGCTLFFLLTGRPPFEGDFAKVIAAIAAEPAPEARSIRSEIPKTLSRLIGQTLEKDSAKRPQTLNELRNALEPFATQGSTFADIGRRVAAFSLDWFYVVSMGGLFTIPAIFLVYLILWQNESWRNDFSQPAQILAPALVVQGLVTVLYFAIAEGLWGCGIGKLIMGLRVTNSKGERPGFLRALLRALILPGLTLLLVGFLPTFFNWQSTLEKAATASSMTSSSAGAMSGVEMALQALAMNYVTWIFSALFFVTLRKRNGFRGLHGFLSGTRVQSHVLRKRIERSSIPLVVPKSIESDSPIDRYQPFGQLSHSDEGDVKVALDPELDRNVWISRSVVASDDQHQSVVTRNRPSRQRWLDGGRDDEGEWNVWEAVRGVPMMQLFASSKHDWPQICALLHEVAEELAEGTKDESIPRPFGVDHIWIDESSQVKFVRPKVNLTHKHNLDETRENGSVGRPANCSPTQALRLLVGQVSESTVVPLHFLEFAKQLNAKKDGAKTLVWATEKLEEFQGKARKWKWDDRLGAIAVSTALEQTLYQTIAFASAFLFASLFMTSFVMNLLFMFAFMVGAAFAIGYWFNGGVVFRFLKIVVCSVKTNSAASRFRCGIRNLIAWSPFVISYSLLSAWISYTVSHTARSGVETSQLEDLLAMIISATWSYPLLLFYLGAFVAILSPRRGIQDFICKTKLFLK